MIAIIDYRAGNLTSVKLAFETLAIDATVTDDPATIARADRVVFPGVGAAGSAMGHLVELGLVDTIVRVVESGTPFLGICLGTQIIFDHSDEDGGVECIGLVPGNVKRFTPSNPYDKVPQIGWNAVAQKRCHPLFDGIEDHSEFYFVHSFHPDPTEAEWVIGETTYADTPFASAVAHENLVATQFHPEKSGKIGLRLLRNFTEWSP